MIAASSAVNSPPWNSAPMIGPAATDQRERRGQGQQHRQLGRAALDVGGLGVLAGADDGG